jgi:multidrug transporter EmrE-like cation transporter
VDSPSRQIENTSPPSPATPTREETSFHQEIEEVQKNNVSNNQQFQKQLDFKSLAKNPVCALISQTLIRINDKKQIWLLGFIIFIASNFVNFVALQFAPQSLVAPLGSMSLVVNVIAAPLINKEKFTWKDILGVALIVVGSSMTVLFAGVNDKGLFLVTVFLESNLMPLFLCRLQSMHTFSTFQTLVHHPIFKRHLFPDSMFVCGDLPYRKKFGLRVNVKYTHLY